MPRNSTCGAIAAGAIDARTQASLLSSLKTKSPAAIQVMKILNSPLFIAILAIAALFILKAQIKPTLANEIRGAYDELIAIAEEAGSDAEKTKAIQDFSKQIASQLKTGFSAGFSSGKEEESREQKFLKAKRQVEISGIKEVPSQWNGQQATLFTITNASALPISQLKLNFHFYKNGALIDAKNEWINEIKVLDTGESLAITKNRALPNQLSDEEKTALAHDKVEIIVTAFEIVQ